jgi:hypothetical protein
VMVLDSGFRRNGSVKEGLFCSRVVNLDFRFYRNGAPIFYVTLITENGRPPDYAVNEESTV